MESVDQIILDRMDITSKNHFITVKDHKENFFNNSTVRLINSEKIDLQKISKATFDTTSKHLCTSLNINQ